MEDEKKAPRNIESLSLAELKVIAFDLILEVETKQRYRDRIIQLINNKMEKK